MVPSQPGLSVHVRVSSQLHTAPSSFSTCSMFSMISLWLLIIGWAVMMDYTPGGVGSRMFYPSTASVRRGSSEPLTGQGYFRFVANTRL